MNMQDRDLRQRDLVPPAQLAACHALVIGVVAVGHAVALQLAAMGVPAMTMSLMSSIWPHRHMRRNNSVRIRSKRRQQIVSVSIQT